MQLCLYTENSNLCESYRAWRGNEKRMKVKGQIYCHLLNFKYLVHNRKQTMENKNEKAEIEKPGILRDMSVDYRETWKIHFILCLFF